ILSSGQEPAPYRLTLREAVQQGVRNNLNVLVANTQINEAEGVSRRYHSALLPHVVAESYYNVQQISLDAFGITGLASVALPQVTPPYTNYDFHFGAQQNLFDLHSYR